jgi:hypothetical protein
MGLFVETEKDPRGIFREFHPMANGDDGLALANACLFARIPFSITNNDNDNTGVRRTQSRFVRRLDRDN